jgi:hypothetical protein
MHTKMLVVAFTGCALALRAQEPPASFGASTEVKPSTNPRSEVPLQQRATPLKLGKSDYTVSGPLVDTFRLKPRVQTERSLGRKILDLPIINMFVPEPWPKTTRQGKYFAWGERDQPWATTVERRPAGPSGVLVSASR